MCLESTGPNLTLLEQKRVGDREEGEPRQGGRGEAIGLTNIADRYPVSPKSST